MSPSLARDGIAWKSRSRI